MSNHYDHDRNNKTKKEVRNAIFYDGKYQAKISQCFLNNIFICSRGLIEFRALIIE